MGWIKLWQFNVATFLVTQILLGVEGWICWIIPALLAFATTRNQPLGSKNYILPAAVWIGLIALAYIGRA